MGWNHGDTEARKHGNTEIRSGGFVWYGAGERGVYLKEDSIRDNDEFLEFKKEGLVKKMIKNT